MARWEFTIEMNAANREQAEWIFRYLEFIVRRNFPRYGPSVAMRLVDDRE